MKEWVPYPRQNCELVSIQPQFLYSCKLLQNLRLERERERWGVLEKGKRKRDREKKKKKENRERGGERKRLTIGHMVIIT